MARSELYERAQRVYDDRLKSQSQLRAFVAIELILLLTRAAHY
jgi:hypothetical protein